MKQQILWVVECRNSKFEDWIPLYMRLSRETARMVQFYNTRGRWAQTRVVKYIRSE